MRRKKGSMGAKIAAWILITVSGLAFVGSCLLILLMHSIHIYDYMSKETFQRKVSEEAATHYSVIALEQYLRERDEQLDGKSGQGGFGSGYIELNDTYFRYGIIKAEKINDMDFNSGSTYVDTNFEEHIREDRLFTVSYEVTPNTQFYTSDNLLGGYSVYSETSETLIQMPVLDISYNTSDGIFYYMGAGSYYPVRNIEVLHQTGDVMRVWHYEYDFEKESYRNVGVTVESEDAETYESGNGAAADTVSLSAGQSTAVTYGLSTKERESIKKELGKELTEMLSREYLNFNIFDGVMGEFYLEVFDGIRMDHVFYRCDGTDIEYVTEAHYAGLSRTEETNYEWTDDNMLQIRHLDPQEAVTYWVVSIMPENVAPGWSSDLFMQANMLVTFVYGLRYGVYVILFVSLAVCAALFVWLISAAGHRPDTDQIVPVWLDTLPFDVFLVLAAAAEAIPLAFIFIIGIRLENEPVRLVLPVFFLICMCWEALYVVLNFAVRVKLGAWWKNTLVWKIGRLAAGFMRAVGGQMKMLWKLLLLMAAVSAVEFMVVIRGGIGPIARFWIFEKVLLVPVFLLAVIQMQKLTEGAAKMAEGDLAHRIDTKEMFWEFKKHGEHLNSISTGMEKAVDESVKSERFKTELITNVSHDIKTPLTSIITYVDLLGKEELGNETAEEYLEVLARQSNRLMKLIEDLMEASKASTGNLAVNPEQLEAGVSMTQTVGEFEEKLQANQLQLLVSKPEEPVYIMADARHLWRVMDNLMNNICKYAQSGTRVYIDLKKQDNRAVITFRNTSKYALNISPEELMERFVRGDSSRNTEGSGLGLSIARSLTELMGGTFAIFVDGDLFKVVLEFENVEFKNASSENAEFDKKC